MEHAKAPFGEPCSFIQQNRPLLVFLYAALEKRKEKDRKEDISIAHR
jgi:hypothetical protein